MNKDIFKSKKFWIIAGIALTVIIVLVVSIVLISNKSKEDNGSGVNNSTTSTTNKDTKKTWPNLKEYDISNLNAGKIDNVKDDCNVNGYKLNYTIDVNSISKEDIDKYIKNFKDWTINESEYYYILVKSTDEAQYSVVITFDEENSTAQFVVTSF